MSIREWVESNVAPDEQRGAWTAIADDWLGVLAEVLGSDYRISRSQRLLLLSPLSDAEAAQLAAFLRTLDGGVAADAEWLEPPL